jgi:hypothetical protein
MSRIDAAHRRDVHRRSAVYVEEIIEERSVPISWPVISFRVNWRLQGNALIDPVDGRHYFREARFSVPILEEGGRLGLKYLLLSYFRVGDNPTGTKENWRRFCWKSASP